MELFKQIASGVAGLAGSALAAYMLHGAEGPYKSASKVFAEHGVDVAETYPQLAWITRSENEASMKALAAAKTRDEKLNLAVQVFLGFWMVNGEGRGDFCKQSGVDFTRFVEKFEKRNARQHARAAAYLEAAGLDEERLYKSRRSDFMKRLRVDMLYMGGPRAVSPSTACNKMQADADKYLGKLDFRVIDPALNQILLGS